jgi:hypothetical protein
MKRITASGFWAALFFVVLLGVGLTIYSSYGMSWDETTQLGLGITNFRYIFKGDPALLSMRDRWYGPLFEVFLVVVQSRGNDAQVFLSRHLLNFLTFYAGCVGFYFLCKRFSRSGWMALVGSACLVLSPRVFANAFYNSKDIPFLVLYVYSLFSLVWFLDRPSPGRGLVHALICAALIAVRLPGVILPALTLLGLGIEVICKRTGWKIAAPSFALYLVAAVGGCVLAWPALWQDPLHGFLEAFRFMSHFPHATTMLYLGQHISSLSLPWHYVPVWIGVTTPLVYLAGFACGVAVITWRLVKALGARFSVERRDELLVVGALLGPLLAVIGLGSVLYDGWRQMLFIYPAFLLVMLKGMQAVHAWLVEHLPKRTAVVLGVGILAAGMLPVAAWMVANHPYQNVYFNALAGKDMITVQQRFMLDYWGLSYRQGIEALLAQDPAAKINVVMETEAGQRTLAILPPAEAARVHVVHDLKDADYFIGNYYLTTGAYPFKDEVFAVHVGNARILSVFRLSEDEKS